MTTLTEFAALYRDREQLPGQPTGTRFGGPVVRWTHANGLQP